MTAAFTQYVDVAQVALYVFWIFFAFLVLHLHREDKREGYPLVDDGIHNHARTRIDGFIAPPPPKVFRRFDGHVSQAPQTVPPDGPIMGVPLAPWPGAPIEPLGDPLLAGVGPGSWAMRRDAPSLTPTGEPRIVPLRVAPDYAVSIHAFQPVGMNVIGADGAVAGRVVELWVDVTEIEARYLEVALPDPAMAHVLLPMTFARFAPRRREVTVRALLAGQFTNIPRTRDPDAVTFREEDQIVGYFGAGILYATPQRVGPLL